MFKFICLIHDTKQVGLHHGSLSSAATATEAYAKCRLLPDTHTHTKHTTLYLYRCSTYTSPYGRFNLFHSQMRKPKRIRQPGTINITISWEPEHRLRSKLQEVRPAQAALLAYEPYKYAYHCCKKKQPRQCKDNVTMGRVRVANAAVETQQLILCVSLSFEKLSTVSKN